jgi:hypothetical protein
MPHRAKKRSIVIHSASLFVPWVISPAAVGLDEPLKKATGIGSLPVLRNAFFRGERIELLN